MFTKPPSRSTSCCTCPQGDWKCSSPGASTCLRSALSHTHSGQVLLRHALALPALLDHFAHLQRDSVMVQLLCFSIELGRVLCDEVLFVLACCPCHSHTNKENHRQTKQGSELRQRDSKMLFLSTQLAQELSRFQPVSTSTDLKQTLPITDCGLNIVNNNTQAHPCRALSSLHG